ncbi:hypothetical protein [Streptomyces sp. NPDC059262]|uniref:hypothetical protein n=1 Tax=Streptomyces sp. NPDC059262 TaxID=3346797 RepID=UPI003698C133
MLLLTTATGRLFGVGMCIAEVKMPTISAVMTNGIKARTMYFFLFDVGFAGDVAAGV